MFASFPLVIIDLRINSFKKFSCVLNIIPVVEFLNGG